MSEFPTTIEIGVDALGDDFVNQINHAMKEVCANIADPNRDPAKKRTVTVNITFNPSADRKKADITYSVSNKLAGDTPGEATVFISLAGAGKVMNIEQTELPLEGVDSERKENQG